MPPLQGSGYHGIVTRAYALRYPMPPRWGSEKGKGVSVAPVANVAALRESGKNPSEGVHVRAASIGLVMGERVEL